MIHSYQTVARYAETDMMGVIHHSVYAIWAEAARTELMSAMGYSYTEIERSGIMLPVTELRLIYKSPTFYEDKITIECAVTVLDNRRFRVDYKIMAKERICCVGYSKHIFMSATTRTSMRISTELINKFTKYFHPEFQQIL